MRNYSGSPLPRSARNTLAVLTTTILLLVAGYARAETSLRTTRESSDPAKARLRVDVSKKSPHPISPFITGKFAEHLFSNITKGKEAQVLVNPTFSQVPFRTGDTTPDGIATFLVEDEKIDPRLKYYATRYGWPDSELENLAADRKAALAPFWTRVGSHEDVLPSPDTAPSGARAQRVEVRNAGQGIEQWAWFPLHRTRKYEFELFLRSPGIKSFTVSLSQSTNVLLSVARVEGVTGQWQKFTGTLELDASVPADKACRFALTADSPGQFVIQRALIFPADHINRADPDVIRMLKESKMPMLRWPGGNFVSAYRWRDGVGPLEFRPTVPNYAWGNSEPNHFGTDEFIQYCRDVGCEPLICVNAGTGTPEEAAQWVEYCNGATNTPMGKLRADNGHPEPYNVKYWEVGNELWGRWQANWTTARGNADRYMQFQEAMRRVDPTIELYGCGAPLHWAKNWNELFIELTKSKMRGITDHSLIGGDVNPSVHPLEVYSDYMAASEVLEKHWGQLEKTMTANGIKAPRLALTELQIFAGIAKPTDDKAPVLLTRTNLIDSSTHAEALFDILIYHTAIRLAPFLDIITHSATVNHGGGLRKVYERVFANPCHYSQSAFAALAGATPVAIEIEAPMEKAPLVVPDLRAVTSEVRFAAIDALAAVSTNELWLSIVHRGRQGAIDLDVDLNGFNTSGQAEIHRLSAEFPWLENDSDSPRKITPTNGITKISGGHLTLHLAPYTVLRVRVPVP